MSYTKLTDFASKDALLSGNPSKVVRGTEIDAEFTSLETEDGLNVKKAALQNGTYTTLSGVSGSDTITAGSSPALTAYSTGQTFRFTAAGANTGAVTLNIDGLGAKAVTKYGTTALVASDIVSGAVLEVSYDGTRFQLIGGGAYARAGLATDLAASSGSSLVGFIQSGAGAVARTAQAKMRDVINVADFLPAGYVTDGTVDYTTYFQAALDAGINATYGTGRTVLVPDGKWQVGDLQVARTGQVIRGESKYGTWLIAKSGATAVIHVGNLTPTYRRHTVIETLSIDYTNISNSVDSAGIIYQNSYGNALRDVHLEASNDNTTTAYALYLGQGCYTTEVSNVDAPRVRIYSATSDRPTTLTFTNLDSGFVSIDNAGAITFLQPIMQSSVAHSFGLYRMNVLNCYTFTCIGGDFEDDDASHYMYYFDNVTQHCVSIGNWSTGFAGGYMIEGATGITGKRMLQDHKTQGFEYREGTWTPTLSWATPGTSTIVPSSATGSYVKVGNMVHCAFNHDNATFTNGTASGNLVLSGLPFTTVSSTTDWWGGTPTTQIGYPTNLQSIVVANNTKTAFFKKSDGSGSNVVVADVSGAGKYIRATFSYKCAN